MIVKEILQLLESWAPRELCWQGDNVGLQIGSPEMKVKKILIALDVTEKVIAEAQKKHANLLISHHPLIFSSLKSLTPETRSGALALKMAKQEIALLSAHTNLDFTHDGVSFALAEKIGLQNISVLAPQEHALQKIAVFVPADYVERVMTAMANAGAGHIGNYESCSFRTNGTGTFRGLNGATPFIGDAGQLERVEEVRLEMLVEKWKISPVLNAMKTAHPYDEVAYDLYSLENRLGNAGAGTIGTLATPESLEKFLQRLRKRLHTGAFRFTGRRAATIRRVAVCGGSGSELIRTAIAAGADAYVTADIKYHTFQDAESNIALIDAGHFETESPIIPKLVSYFTKQLTGLGEQIPVFASTTMSNPVCYYS